MKNKEEASFNVVMVIASVVLALHLVSMLAKLFLSFLK